jgi:predicted RNA methylase
VGVEVIAAMQFDLPKTYAFHKEKNKTIAVDLIRFVHLKPRY